MTHLVGPVYVAHPYSSPTADGRRANVERAALMSSAVNLAGAATVSPLQESLGREGSGAEDMWRENGLVTLRVCKAIVLPRDYHFSSGCVEEFHLARWIGMPCFLAELWDSHWVLPPEFAVWVADQRARVPPALRHRIEET